ncbi:DUF317 domain-containing protein [Streptomyces sp. NPDC001851]|uniref:DUF317 domain-containing protein n=1 Tax=Streptomyces sp. NPDC001851 TaxID=3154529 RepID=UPI00331B6E25
MDHRRKSLGSRLAPSWRAWGGQPDEPQWSVQFTPSTPTTLVAAFTASLLSTEPVERTVKDVPFFTRHHVSVAVATPTAKPPKPFTPVATPPPRPAVSRTR